MRTYFLRDRERRRLRMKSLEGTVQRSGKRLTVGTVTSISFRINGEQLQLSYFSEGICDCEEAGCRNEEDTMSGE